MNKLKTTILSLCLILMCISIVSSVSAIDDGTFYNMTNPFYDNGIFCNMTNPFSSICFDGKCYNIDENGNFELTIRGNPSTGYYWEFDKEASSNVELIKQYYVVDEHPPGWTGVPGTYHFIFHVLDQNKQPAVKFNEIRSGEVVDTLTSDMLN